MSETVTVQSRINPELKKHADAVFADMGMSIADAIRIFLHQSVNVGGLPFQPVSKIPNAQTIAAFAEIEQGKAQPISLETLRLDAGLKAKK